MSFTLVILVFIAELSVCACCHSFENTQMTVVSREGERFQSSVTGCLERKTFNNKTIVEIYIKDQPVPILERDAIRHLVKLHTLSITNCQVKSIQPALFRNILRIKVLEITSNQVEQIQNGIFPSLVTLEVLKLSNNHISVIHDDAFTNLTHLRDIHCAHNLLSKWSREWFGSATNIEIMNFQANKIRVLPFGAFFDFRKLKIVNFNFNELETIPEVFRGNTSLDYLGLRYNRLVTLDARVFPQGVTIGRMAIGANYLNFLPVQSMWKIQMKELEVKGNPWTCACLEQIYHWLHTSNGSVQESNYCKGRDVPVCGVPSSYLHSCREDVDKEVTEHFLGVVRSLEPPLNRFCVRLD